MLYLRKKGFALINTIIIISLITTLGCFMFKLIKSNRDMAAMYYVDEDIFSVDLNEEELIYEFMRILNKKSEEIESNMSLGKKQNMEVESVVKSGTEVPGEKDVIERENKEITSDEKIINGSVFDNNFEEKYRDGKLIYQKDTDTLKLMINGEYDALRIRELRYIIRENKVILIPTSNFIDTNINNNSF